MKLFDVVPESFFRLLTGTNKGIYAEAVLLLYEQSQQERFGIRYEIMRDLIQELIESNVETGMFVDLEQEDSGDEVPHHSSSPSETPAQVTMEEWSRAQANALIRRLDALGWIDVEDRDQYQKYIVLPHYSSRILALFQELCEDRKVEYQRYAFITYQLLTGEEAKLRPAFAIREAWQYAKEFERELTTLYNNMKHHMEQVVQKTSLGEVLDHHFEQYKTQIVDKSYHRLKTSDHVSRYRFQILETVHSWLLDKDWMDEAMEDGVRSELYDNRDQADSELRRALYQIEDTFSGLDDIFYQIDVRHNQYLRSSYDRARYLSQHSQGLDQQLSEVLERLGGLESESAEKILSSVTTFQINEIRYLTGGSLLPPRRKRPPHEPQAHVIIEVPEELKEQLKTRNLQKMRKAITRRKVEEFVTERLGDRIEMPMEELAPKNIEEFLLLTYVYLYGQDGSSRFALKRNKDRQILWIGDYRFHNHTVMRKGGVEHVKRA